MEWVSSTLIFVSDVAAAVEFYAGRLGFTIDMRYEEEGRLRVAGVSRGDGCALLLTDQWPDKVGKAVIYVALDVDAFAGLRSELVAQDVQPEEGFWGKDLMVLADPDDNRLFFPLPDEWPRSPEA